MLFLLSLLESGEVATEGEGTIVTDSSYVLVIALPDDEVTW